jgi:hypothetical protein
MRARHGVLFIMLALAGVPAGRAARTNEAAGFSTVFLGYESEPAMQYLGRTFVSLDAASAGLIGKVLPAERRPFCYFTPAYEVPLAVLWSTLQHEINGHGSRAREFHLDPSYGFGFDLSAYTELGKDPGSNEELALLAGGGTEGDSVLAHDIVLDAFRPEGIAASIAPLMLLAKLDFTIYCLATPDPREPKGEGDDFVDQYRDGNDIAIYLVTRQAQRNGASASDVWNDRYTIDFQDSLLNDTYDDVYNTAIWNLLDPSMWAIMVPYAWDHVAHGQPLIRAPVVPLGGRFGLSAGTRGFIGPSEVTRFLDVYLVTPIGLATVYARDLESSSDRAYGFGGGFHGLRMGPHLGLSLEGDYWDQPAAAEAFFSEGGWNADAEIEIVFTPRWGLSVKGGYKERGYLPGTPADEGAYVGAGLRVSL